MPFFRLLRVIFVAAVAVTLAAPAMAFLEHAPLPGGIGGSVARYQHLRSRQHRRPAVLNLAGRFTGDVRYPRPQSNNENPKWLERRDLLLLAVGSALLAPKGSDAAAMGAKPVVVIGAAGLTGGECLRALLRSKIPVVACTRRPVTFSSRDKLAPGALVSKDTLLLNESENVKQVRVAIADVLLPGTLPAALEGAQAVIYVAGTRPKVDVTTTPGTNPGGNAKLSSSSLLQMNLGGAKIGAQNAIAEDVGLVNVAKECLRLGIPRLVIVSSICAKCRGKRNEEGEQIDRGTASCEICYQKAAGEKAVRDLYASAAPRITYTIVRPGLLSRGEARGAASVELNQGLSKSGIISRTDLAQLLVAAAVGDADGDEVGGKSFEVYYSDTAQPVDMYASLASCKEAGRSVKECFFGKGFDDSKPLSLEQVLKKPLEGSLFPSGSEVQGSSYPEMFRRLKPDVAEPFDLDSLAASSII